MTLLKLQTFSQKLTQRKEKLEELHGKLKVKKENLVEKERKLREFEKSVQEKENLIKTKMAAIKVTKCSSRSLDIFEIFDRSYE